MGLDTSSNEPSGIRARFRSVLPSDRFGDQLAILSGTSQNIAGLAIYVVASLGTNVLISRVLGASALGVVTLATQFAFVAGAATRFGMDAATVRQVAIDVGGGRAERVRSVMTRAAAIAGSASVLAGLLVFLGAGILVKTFAGAPVRVAVPGLPGRDPGAQDHAVHGRYLLGRPARRVDRPHGIGLDRGQDPRHERSRLRALVGRGHGRGVVRVGAIDAIVRTGPRRRRGDQGARSLRRTARPGGAPGAAAVLDGLLRGEPVRDEGRPRGLRGGRSRGPGAGAVPDRRQLHVQPLRRRSARTRGARSSSATRAGSCQR